MSRNKVCLDMLGLRLLSGSEENTALMFLMISMNNNPSALREKHKRTFKTNHCCRDFA